MAVMLPPFGPCMHPQTAAARPELEVEHIESHMNNVAKELYNKLDSVASGRMVECQQAVDLPLAPSWSDEVHGTRFTVPRLSICKAASTRRSGHSTNVVD